MKFLDKTPQLILLVIPKTKFGDLLYHYLTFIFTHWRIPRSGSHLFNDLLFFLKVGDELELEERKLISDKEMVKQYIASSVGKKYIVPTIKILETEEEIANYEFPANCCIKPTHASGLYIYYE